MNTIYWLISSRCCFIHADNTPPVPACMTQSSHDATCNHGVDINHFVYKAFIAYAFTVRWFGLLALTGSGFMDHSSSSHFTASTQQKLQSYSSIACSSEEKGVMACTTWILLTVQTSFIWDRYGRMLVLKQCVFSAFLVSILFRHSMFSVVLVSIDSSTYL